MIEHMKYIIHEVDDDIHEELGLYGVDFDDSDIVAKFTSRKEGSIHEVPDLNVTIFKTDDHTVAVFPIDDSVYDTVDTYEMREVYRKFIDDYDGYNHVVSQFQVLTGKVIDPEVWIVSIPATLLEDTLHTFQTKQGPQTLRVRSYIIKKSDTVPKDAIRFDTHAVHALCNNALDFDYLQDSLKPSEMVNVLVTVFEKDDIGVAIRTTKLKSGSRAEIKGAYACSKGFGTLIQGWTENIIRTYDDVLFPTSVAGNKPTTFRLSALASAVGFWKHVGFQSTGKFDKDGQEILEKRIYPEAIIGTKRKMSRSPSSSTDSNTSAKTSKNKLTRA